MKGKAVTRKLIAALVVLAFIASTVLILPATALALTWSSAGTPVVADSNIYDVAHDGTNLFAGGLNGLVYYNTNPTGGGAWTSAGNPGGGGSRVFGLDYDGINLYAGCDNGNVYYNSNPTGGGEPGPAPVVPAVGPSRQSGASPTTGPTSSQGVLTGTSTPTPTPREGEPGPRSPIRILARESCPSPTMVPTSLQGA